MSNQRFKRPKEYPRITATIRVAVIPSYFAFTISVAKVNFVALSNAVKCIYKFKEGVIGGTMGSPISKVYKIFI